MSLIRVFNVFLAGVDYGVVVHTNTYRRGHVATHHKSWVKFSVYLVYLNSLHLITEFLNSFICVLVLL